MRAKSKIPAPSLHPPSFTFSPWAVQGIEGYSQSITLFICHSSMVTFFPCSMWVRSIICCSSWTDPVWGFTTPSTALTQLRTMGSILQELLQHGFPWVAFPWALLPHHGLLFMAAAPTSGCSCRSSPWAVTPLGLIHCSTMGFSIAAWGDLLYVEHLLFLVKVHDFQLHFLSASFFDTSLD